jgi:hypothetical protein
LSGNEPKGAPLARFTLAWAIRKAEDPVRSPLSARAAGIEAQSQRDAAHTALSYLLDTSMISELVRVTPAADGTYGVSGKPPATIECGSDSGLSQAIVGIQFSSIRWRPDAI